MVVMSEEFLALSSEERRARLAEAGRSDCDGLPADVSAWLAKADEAMIAEYGEAAEPVLVDRRSENQAG